MKNRIAVIGVGSIGSTLGVLHSVLTNEAKLDPVVNQIKPMEIEPMPYTITASYRDYVEFNYSPAKHRTLNQRQKRKLARQMGRKVV